MNIDEMEAFFAGLNWFSITLNVIAGLFWFSVGMIHGRRSAKRDDAQSA